MALTKFTRSFNQLSIRDVSLVGGKNASLGEMYQKLTRQGITVPDGFAITAKAYFYFLKKSGLLRQMQEIFSDLDTHNVKNLMARGKQVRELILRAEFPLDLQKQIVKAYRRLEKKYGTNVDVAVRSSATAEDLPDASFAGQQETFLNIRGHEALLDASRRCMASLFTNRAISYRGDKGFDHFKIGLSVGVQKMVRSDKSCSGVMFTIHTESGFENAVLINGAWGLGENIVKGVVTPDEFLVFKGTLATHKPIIGSHRGSKEIKMIYDRRAKQHGQSATKNVKTTKIEREKLVLSEKEILKLANWGVQIERHYGRPMDIEWAKDGQTKQLYIVQARPETVHATRNKHSLEEYQLKKRGQVLVSGAAVGSKIAVGKVKVINDIKGIRKFQAGEILVTGMTDPDWEPIMKIAGGIIADRGGRTCHAAIVSRELGIPCVVGTEDATKKLKTGQSVTLSCAEGEKGMIYAGELPFEIKKTNLRQLRRPKTQVMMNIGEPDLAFKASFIPNDGVGLARQEFIINEHIKIHPLALLNFNKLKDKKAKQKIKQLTAGYKKKSDFFVDKLAEGVAQIAAAFYPKQVIVRLSDFRSNEYANLIGGKQFEPEESNPMIGWRGASRYYADEYKDAFILECKALRKAREVMGLDNICIMVPFCRTVEEGERVIEIMAKQGLKRGQGGLEIFVMCEIPSNVISAHEFAEIFDGFSIGSNDLTQLTLGVDRDSQLVAHVYDERNPAVKALIRRVIQQARAAHRKIGICGQAPSDFPDFARFLVQQGIDSISLTPDTVVKTTLAILDEEKRLKRRKTAKKRTAKKT